MTSQRLLPREVKTSLGTVRLQNRRTILLTCGISGSGKSTLARSIVNQYQSFICVSIDSYIHEKHGIYNKDFLPAKYPAILEEARKAVKEELRGLLREGKNDVVVDNSFWSREVRDEYRELIRKEGRGKYKVLLVLFKGGEDFEEVLWRRIKERGRVGVEVGVGEGRTTGRELLRRFLNGFEWPDGEGKILVHVG